MRKPPKRENTKRNEKQKTVKYIFENDVKGLLSFFHPFFLSSFSFRFFSSLLFSLFFLSFLFCLLSLFFAVLLSFVLSSFALFPLFFFFFFHYCLVFLCIFGFAYDCLVLHRSTRRNGTRLHRRCRSFLLLLQIRKYPTKQKQGNKSTSEKIVKERKRKT